jgi:hypothetical protein
MREKYEAILPAEVGRDESFADGLRNRCREVITLNNIQDEGSKTMPQEILY